MKRPITIFILFLCGTVAAKAQKEVLLKMKVMPNRSYSSVMKMTMNTVMDLSRDSTLIKPARKSDQMYPMVTDIISGSTTNIKTKAINANGNIPFAMDLKLLPTTMTTNGKETSLPTPLTNETVFGTYAPDGKMNIDSVTGKNADALLKGILMKTMKQFPTIVKFPEKPMKVGDAFTEDLPVEMPIAGLGAKMTSKTTYKLTAIENNMAYFDVKFEMAMDMKGQATTMDLSGSGDGKFVLDIPANYGVDRVSNMDIVFSMTMPQAPTRKMTGKMKMAMDYKTAITNAN